MAAHKALALLREVIRMKKTAHTVIREGNVYTIAAVNNRVLEVADYNTENGASVRLWSYEGQPWQQWKFVEAGENEWRIVNCFTDKAMDLALGGNANGTWVHQWASTPGKSQRWVVEELDNGRVKLRNVLSKKVIDLKDMSIENGAQAQIWNDVDGENQTWRIDLVPARQIKTVSQVPAPAPVQAAPKPTRIQTGKGSRAKKAAGKAARRAK